MEQERGNQSSSVTISLLMKQLYLHHIGELVEQVNKASKEEKRQLLEQIKESDKFYLEALGLVIHGKVLFTRHGECGVWAQKKLGANPNSAISENAEQNMSQTNEMTDALLSHPDKPPRIAISPLVRAMQTASLLIPKEIKANISVEVYLSENSSAPSGLDIRSQEDLLAVKKQTPFFSLKRFLLFLASIFYGTEDFKLLKDKRDTAIAKIQKHNIPGQHILKDNKLPQSLDYEGDKIKDTKKLIDETGDEDLWLIGHGKNFSAFFDDAFGIDRNFKYCETRTAYRIKAAGLEPTLYTPPYALVVNQQTGEIEGLYTGISIASTKGGHKGVDAPEVRGAGTENASLKTMGKGLGPTHILSDRAEPSDEEAVVLLQKASEQPDSTPNSLTNIQCSAK